MSILLTGCAPTKKLVKTEARTEIETTVKKVDTTKSEAAWQSVVDQIGSQIDLSKIRIVTYYQSIDSSGKQAIKEDVTIEKNVMIYSQAKSKDQAILKEAIANSEEISQLLQIRNNEELKENKSIISFKYYILGCVLCVLFSYIGYKYLKKIF